MCTLAPLCLVFCYEKALPAEAGLATAECVWSLIAVLETLDPWAFDTSIASCCGV